MSTLFFYLPTYLSQSGIGRATAVRFAAEGCKVYATDVNEELLQELQSIEGHWLGIDCPLFNNDKSCANRTLVRSVLRQPIN